MEIVMEKSNSDKIIRQIAKEKVHKLKQFYTHLFIYAFGVAFYVAKTYFGVRFDFWPVKFINWFVMLLWTLCLIIQALQLFLTTSFFGSNWEERKIQEIIERNKIEKQKWQ